MIVFFLGDNTKIQNNYFVHMLTICFQPFCLALILKYNIFGWSILLLIVIHVSDIYIKKRMFVREEIEEYELDENGEVTR